MAILSFGFARYHYVEAHSVSVSNPFKSSQRTKMSDPFLDQSLFGSWVKDEWVFALAVPGLLIIGGIIVSARR